MMTTNGTLRGDIECMMTNWLRAAFGMATFARWFRLRFSGVDRTALERLCRHVERRDLLWDEAVNAFVSLTGQPSETPSSAGRALCGPASDGGR